MRSVVLDIDGVLANFYSGFAKYLNDRFEVSLDLSKDPTGYVFSEWGCNLDSIDIPSAINDWVSSNGFAELPIYKGAANFANTLSSIVNVHIVTARIGDFKHDIGSSMQNIIKRSTIEWFNKHNIGINNDIVFTHKKKDYCIDNNIGIIIEDKLSTVIETSSVGVDSILVNRGWNQHHSVPKIHRVSGYNNIIDLVEKLA